MAWFLALLASSNPFARRHTVRSVTQGFRKQVERLEAIAARETAMADEAEEQAKRLRTEALAQRQESRDALTAAAKVKALYSDAA